MSVAIIATQMNAPKYLMPKLLKMEEERNHLQLKLTSILLLAVNCPNKLQPHIVQTSSNVSRKGENNEAPYDHEEQQGQNHFIWHDFFNDSQNFMTHTQLIQALFFIEIRVMCISLG